MKIFAIKLISLCTLLFLTIGPSLGQVTNNEPLTSTDPYGGYLEAMQQQSMYDAQFLLNDHFNNWGSDFSLFDDDEPSERQVCLVESFNEFYECSSDAIWSGYFKEIGSLAAGGITWLFSRSKAAAGYVTTALSGAVVVEFHHELMACNGERLLRDLGCENIEASLF